jgi:very-short-patch-repair endonuclease
MTDECKFEIEFIDDDDEDKDEDEDEDEDGLNTYSYISNHLCFEYFIGYEIAALLGYKNPAEVIKNNVSKSNKLEFRDYPGIKEPEIDPRTILITRDGAVEILIKTRKRVSPDVAYILKKFNIETTNRKCLTKEQQTLSTITNVFKTEKFEDQYKIDMYYLDLFFSDCKIVIECDEFGHADRKPYKERDRQDYVNKKLDIDDSHWIRYNPDERDFDIAKVIGRIYRKMDEIKDKRKQEEYRKLLEESKLNKQEIKKKGLRKCRKCNIEKPFTVEFFGLCGSGLSILCKDCCLTTGTGNEKPVKQYDINGKFIKRFNSIREAAELTDVKAVSIAQNCRGVIKTSGNYIWSFVNKEETKDNKEEIKDNKEENDDDYELEDVTDEDEDDEDEEDGDEENEKDINIVRTLVIKTVAQYNPDGTFVKTYKSGCEAAEDMNVTRGSIYGAIRNGFVSKGYLWRYVKNGKILDKIEEVTPHRKYMKQVEIFKDGKLHKEFISIKKAADYMKVNVTMARKFLDGKKDPAKFEWKFKLV